MDLAVDMREGQEKLQGRLGRVVLMYPTGECRRWSRVSKVVKWGGVYGLAH